MSPDVAASIKARLLNEARRRDEESELILVRYACERFLYRLGASRLRDRRTLKGAGLLTLWMQDPYGATRDVHLLASGGNDEATVRANMETICGVPCPEDGLAFDLDSRVLPPDVPTGVFPAHRGGLTPASPIRGAGRQESDCQA